jgi:hypothetical protein
MAEEPAIQKACRGDELVGNQERSMSINGRDKMTSGVSRGRSEGRFLGQLRAVALIVALAGAVGSAGLTLYAGRHNQSRLLPALFTIWVLSPFMALVIAHVVSKRWSALTRTALYSLMLVLTLGSLGVYADVALWPPRSKGAFVFVIVPPVSWLLLALVVPIAGLISGRLSHPGGGA